MTGVAKGTILSLLGFDGKACREYHNRTVRDLACQHIQCDETRSFVYAKEGHLAPDHDDKIGHGDAWTWTALDADTKLVVNWMVGGCSGETAYLFMQDTAYRLANRVQLTTDGYKAYLEAVEEAFAGEIDCAQLIKLYGADPDGEHLYSPAACIGTETNMVTGNPDRAHTVTSYVGRQNLTMRMSMRRFTRLTNGFSKKIENLGHAVSLHFLFYIFYRPHKSLQGQTPAMAAGMAFHQWEIMEVVSLIKAGEA